MISETTQPDAMTLSLGPIRLMVPREDPVQYYETLIAGVYSSLRLLPGDVVLDLGANVGDFTVLAASAVGPAGRVIAVEPSAYWRSFLESNLRLNRLRNVTVIPMGVGAERTEKSFSVNSLNIGWKGGEKLATGAVSTDTSDAIIRLAGSPTVTVAKIDVEGAEVEALEGQRFLEGLRELAVETHSSLLFNRVCELLHRERFDCTFVSMAEILGNSAKAILAHPQEVSRSELATRCYGFRRLTKALGRRGGLKIANQRQDSLRLLFAHRS